MYTPFLWTHDNISSKLLPIEKQGTQFSVAADGSLITIDVNIFLYHFVDSYMFHCLLFNVTVLGTCSV